MVGFSVREFRETITDIGGEAGLRDIASKAVQKCMDDFLLDCLRDSFKLQFGWPKKRGSQVRLSEHIDVSEGRLSRFKNGEDSVFLEMPRRRLDDILWRMNIDPGNARPEREDLLHSVMRETLRKLESVRQESTLHEDVAELTDEQIDLIAQCTAAVDIPPVSHEISEHEFQQLHKNVINCLNRGMRLYVTDRQELSDPYSLIERARAWMEVYEFLPYQFVLLITTYPLFKIFDTVPSVDLTPRTPEEERKDKEKALKEEQIRDDMNLMRELIMKMPIMQQKYNKGGKARDEATKWMFSHKPVVEQTVKEVADGVKALIDLAEVSALRDDPEYQRLQRKRRFVTTQILDSVGKNSGDLRIFGKYRSLMSPANWRNEALMDQFLQESGLEYTDDENPTQ